jgi:hypothetical protein
MTKPFLTSVAVLFLATGTAHADDKLPKNMLGMWCISNIHLAETKDVYFRAPKHCNDMTDGITIDQAGYVDDSAAEAFSCLVDEVKQTGRDTYLVRTQCTEKIITANGEMLQGTKLGFVGSEELQLAKGLLFKKQVARANIICATVDPPANDGTDARWGKGVSGYLNVREKPDAKSKIVDGIRAYSIAYFDNDSPVKGWKHIYHVTAEGFEEGKGEIPINGWVRDKYLKVGAGSCPMKPGEYKGTIPGLTPPQVY